VTILFIGDIFGQPGREMLAASMPNLRDRYRPDFIVANGENAAAGRGITFATADDLFKSGVDVITMGNHTWSRKEILNIIEANPRLIRPANYPKGVPGKGRTLVEKNGMRLGVVNLMGRIYMDIPLDDPFQIVDRELQALRGQADIILVDFHAEATSEKLALAMYADGRAAAVIGTHTHVQTADNRILPKGTAYISDVGMTGPADGIIGVDAKTVLQKFLTSMPAQFEPAEGRTQLNAVVITTRPDGMADRIDRIML
jgi:metallophosphoesterase (TIGR00282 family)